MKPAWRVALPPAQLLKIVVYSLLLVNYVQYIGNDLHVARHTVHEGWRFVDWTGAFATSLDLTAWLTLLFLLELETYLLSDDAFTQRRVAVMHALRILCVLAIAHTVFAFVAYLMDLSRAVEYSGASLCRFADQGLSFARNLEYADLTAANCASLSPDTHFFQFAQGQAITDTDGMRIEWELAWVDLLEVLAWLVILTMIEVMVRLQEKGVTRSPLRRFAKNCKAVMYIALWLMAVYWGYRGHWLFVWDMSLWILGFAAIGLNLSQWRKEIEEKEGAPVDQTSSRSSAHPRSDHGRGGVL